MGSLSNSNTWLVMVGGAVAVASSLLNLQPTMDELSKKACNWENFNWDSQPGEQIIELLKKLERYPSQNSELLENMLDITNQTPRDHPLLNPPSHISYMLSN